MRQQAYPVALFLTFIVALAILLAGHLIKPAMRKLEQSVVRSGIFKP